MTLEKNIETSSLEAEFRIFSNDLEKALGESEEFHIRLGDTREIQEADSLIFDYLYERVHIKGKGWESATVNYIGKRVDNDLTFIYLEYANVSHWGEVTITNNILFDIYPGQQNQISYISGKNIKSESTFTEYPKRTFNFGE